ncbi:hypothetical protein NJB1604_27170 [Mycobacterium marinum]|nr:hypothetical protein NJB1604_27170 [Mycobacterium marinum]
MEFGGVVDDVAQECIPACSRDRHGLHKFIDDAEARWWAINTPAWSPWRCLPQHFHKGKLLERPTNITAPQPPSDDVQRAGTEVA